MNRVVEPARQATQPGGIGSQGVILGLLESLKILAQQAEDFEVQVAFSACGVNVHK